MRCRGEAARYGDVHLAQRGDECPCVGIHSLPRGAAAGETFAPACGPSLAPAPPVIWPFQLFFPQVPEEVTGQPLRVLNRRSELSAYRTAQIMHS